MKIKIWHILLIIFCMSTFAFAQDDELSRFFSDDENDFQEFTSFEDEVRKEMGDFYAESAYEIQSFKDERDRDFAEFLKEKWEAFEEFEGLVKDPKPKPKVFPKAAKKPADDKIIPQGKPVKPLPPPAPEPPVVVAPIKTEPAPEPPVVITPTKPEPPVVVIPPRPEPPPAVPQPPSLRVSYLGRDLKITCDPSLAATISKINNREIGAYWEKMGTADFDPLISSLLSVKKSLRLNDWGYFQLVQATGDALHGMGNDATLFAWFALTKSGYRIKVGYSDGRVFLLAPVGSLVYQAPYYTLGGTRFYNISYYRDSRKPGRIYTYNKDYPRAVRLLTLDLPEAPRVGDGREIRQLNFKYKNKTHSVPVAYNRNAIRFYESYPQTDWAVYFAAQLAPEAEQSLVSNLGKLVAGKSETEAVNILLRFAQTAFEYQTDDEQFGREKYMFAEETVAFRYSDCEDRSILFSYLVRKIVGLEVVGLHFPGHIATAVRFTENVKGDAIIAGGQRYVVCDPTYINANIGMMMPQFKDVNPEIIRFGL